LGKLLIGWGFVEGRYEHPEVLVAHDAAEVLLGGGNPHILENVNSVPPGSTVLVLKTTYQAVERRFQEVTGRWPRGRIRFDRKVDISSGPGLIARQTLRHVVSQIEDNDILLLNRSLRVTIDVLLIGTLLSLPHSQVSQLLDDSGDVVPAIVHRAESFMEAHATGPIAMRDVVGACACSASMLYRAFQRFRGYTPNEFLNGQRLEAARLRLLSSSQGDPLAFKAITSLPKPTMFNALVHGFDGLVLKQATP
jgi:AraC-like DNA-binding protein